MSLTWNKKSDVSYEANLANVLVLTVSYYEGFGWRGSIQGAFFFPLHTNFYKIEEAQKATIETAKHILCVTSEAANKLQAEN